jgi:hypothetical protein
VKAHSKTVLIFDKSSKDGVVLVHSMPKYPSFEGNRVSSVIPDGQKVYGQHFMCFRVKGAVMGDILRKIQIARVNIYKTTYTVEERNTTGTFFLS